MIEGGRPLSGTVRVAGNKIDYLVNGTTVHSTPKSGLTAKTDGIYGVRVNHLGQVCDNGACASNCSTICATICGGAGHVTGCVNNGCGSGPGGP